MIHLYPVELEFNTHQNNITELENVTISLKPSATNPLPAIIFEIKK